MEIWGIAPLNANMALRRRHITLISSSRRGMTADIKRVLTSWMSGCRVKHRNDGWRCRIVTDGGSIVAGIIKTSSFFHLKTFPNGIHDTRVNAHVRRNRWGILGVFLHFSGRCSFFFIVMQARQWGVVAARRHIPRYRFTSGQYARQRSNVSRRACKVDVTLSAPATHLLKVPISSHTCTCYRVAHLWGTWAATLSFSQWRSWRRRHKASPSIGDAISCLTNVSSGFLSHEVTFSLSVWQILGLIEDVEGQTSTRWDNFKHECILNVYFIRSFVSMIWKTVDMKWGGWDWKWEGLNQRCLHPQSLPSKHMEMRHSDIIPGSCKCKGGSKHFHLSYTFKSPVYMQNQCKVAEHYDNWDISEIAPSSRGGYHSE